MAGPNDSPEDEEDRDPDDIEEGSVAGSIDDDAGEQYEEGAAGEGEEASERLSRRDARIREELRAEREHRNRVEQELQALRQERDRPRAPREETDDEFNARVALLDPEQRVDAKLDRAQKQHQRQLAYATFAAADRADRTAYEARAQSDPIYRKYRDEVERVLQVERSKGRDFDRETVLDFVRGRALRLNAGKTDKARQQGQRNIQREQARTVGGRGDAAPMSRGQKRYAPNDMSPEAVRSRLERDDAYI